MKQDDKTKIENENPAGSGTLSVELDLDEWESEQYGGRREDPSDEETAPEEDIPEEDMPEETDIQTEEETPGESVCTPPEGNRLKDPEPSTEAGPADLGGEPFREGAVGLTHPKAPQGLLRSRDGLWAAFLVPMAIMVIIFAQRGIFPFGEESFLRTDLYHQYAPFFSEFRQKLADGGSLFYSWNIGMGVNFAALYAYYLASPLNWLLVLCPQNLVIEFITYSIVLKIGLSGWAFAFYLTRHQRLFAGDGGAVRNDHAGARSFGVAFFGIFYALSGYMAAYSWNIMWLDCIFLFPLVLLGLERLVKEQRCLLYCIALGLSILSNYYISILVCLFMALYFIALLILEGKQKISHWFLNLFQFGFFSLLAGGLAAVVLLPEIAALEMTASGDFNFPKAWDSYFPVFDMIARHLPDVKTEIGLEHWPNIYCGAAVFLLFGIYLLCKKISTREKAVYCGLLLLLLASFAINVPNFIWHGFHYPNSLPCRQSFIYIALLLLMCYQAYENLGEVAWKQIVMVFWGSVVFVLLAQKLVTENHFHFSVFYIALLYLALYTGLMYLYKFKKAGMTALVLLTLALVSIEAAVNTTITSVTTVSRTAYTKDNAYVRALMGRLRDPGFYRVEKVERKTKNDGAWLHFPSASLFSSTANADLTAFFKTLGCESSTNSYSITGSTPLVDMLASIKYALSNVWNDERLEQKMIDQEGDMYLYENTYTLPLGFMVTEEFEHGWKRDLGNPAAVQNNLCEVMGTPPVLEEGFGETSGNTYSYTPQEDGRYYIYVSNNRIKDVTVSVNDWSKSFSNTDRGYLLDIGYRYAGETILLKADDAGQQCYANIYRFVPERMEALYQKLNQAPWELTSIRDTRLEGTVVSPDYLTLFTSIPYDEGWKVWMDGKLRTPKKVLDTFLGVDLPKGEHTLVLQYEPQGFKTGTLITGVCVLATALLGFLSIRMKQADKNIQRGRRWRRGR